jgi:prepilin-type N-terminal cleavage/methylation domain-containing protein
MKVKNNKAFTLIEVLLVIAIIAVLAAAVFVAINPAKNISDARNTQRRSDITQILSALSQGFIENVTLSGIPTCVATPAGTHLGTGVGLVNPSALVPAYIAGIPIDPQGGTAADTGYSICTTSLVPVRYKVMAPNAENGVTLSVER